MPLQVVVCCIVVHSYELRISTKDPLNPNQTPHLQKLLYSVQAVHVQMQKKQPNKKSRKGLRRKREERVRERPIV